MIAEGDCWQVQTGEISVHMAASRHVRRINWQTAAIVQVLCIACGCSHTTRAPSSERAPRTPVDSGPLKRLDIDVSQIFLAPEPFQSIVVELHWVEGAEPPEAAIDGLLDFLETHCHKPARIARRRAISRDAAEGIRPTVLALSHMEHFELEGPDQQGAYLYVLFYNSRQSHTPTFLPKEAGGVVIGSYPCMICIDVAPHAGFLPLPRRLVVSGLKHEAGHVLGLCRNPQHGDGWHCRNRSCLMRESLSVLSALLGREPTTLCDDCTRDLAEARSPRAADNVEFHGPILVRKEKGYTVFCLPAFRALFVGSGPDMEPLDVQIASGWDWLIERAREAASQLNAAERPDVFAWMAGPSITSRQEFLARRWAIDAALRDPDSKVRHVAEDLKKKLVAEFGALPTDFGAGPVRGGPTQTPTGTATRPSSEPVP